MAELAEERGTELMRILEAWQRGLRDAKAVGKAAGIRDKTRVAKYLHYLEQADWDPIVARQLIVARAIGFHEIRIAT